ncbi:hypothetical protein B0H67DRAFT_101510 [Lasiosphaeris hirsuta]|uniref:C2H2-type domain-containing protein n=1 Tax=Lasiosphaeris hirsuta TaxID=260670 RepID=A0AA40AYA3_9PEZI|nr:hypothetical protein B0H67DRAFT_101510 [Lasiosphaeris hirsuta]
MGGSKGNNHPIPLDNASIGAIVRLLQNGKAVIKDPNLDIPDELREKWLELEECANKILVGDSQINSKRQQTALEDPRPPHPESFKCMYCEKASNSAADCKKHLLKHERDYESWVWDSSRHKTEADFHKHHKKDCSDCRGWDKKVCQKSQRSKRGEFGTCLCCRCYHARAAVQSNVAQHACGFCFDNLVFKRWDPYFSHIRKHFKEHKPESEWRISRVIYALICNDDALLDAFGQHSVDKETNLPQNWKDPKFWQEEMSLQTLRHDLQLYNANDNRYNLVEQAREWLEASEEPKFSPAPGNSHSPCLGSGLGLQKAVSAARPTSVSQENWTGIDTFMGAPSETAEMEAAETLSPLSRFLFQAENQYGHGATYRNHLAQEVESPPIPVSGPEIATVEEDTTMTDNCYDLMNELVMEPDKRLWVGLAQDNDLLMQWLQYNAPHETATLKEDYALAEAHDPTPFHSN